jgi:hypothetical protein
MIWIAAYLLSIIACAVVVGLIQVEHSNVRLENPSDIWGTLLFVSIWPLILIAIPFLFFFVGREDRLRQNASNILHKCNLGRDRNNREFVIAIPEDELKILLKASRKDLIKLEPAQIEIIRDELMHRMTERTLLK